MSAIFMQKARYKPVKIIFPSLKKPLIVLKSTKHQMSLENAIIQENVPKTVHLPRKKKL